MKLNFHTLDVFSGQKFGGNPLAVVHDADGLTSEQMQAITREFNLSETVFVLRPDQPEHSAKIRIFFPGGEMPFAGHPVLGTAVLLAELVRKPGCNFETDILLELKAGLTPVRVTRIADETSGTLTAPIVPFKADVPLPARELVARSLALTVGDIEFEDHRIVCLEGGPRFFYVPISSRNALTKCKVIEPYWSEMLNTMPGVDAAYVYTRGGDARDTNFRARMFAPTGGIPEDPATGSASALLAAQLITAESLADGKHSFRLEQGYEMGRPSDLALECTVQNGKLISVKVGGKAVRMMSGELEI